MKISYLTLVNIALATCLQQSAHAEWTACGRQGFQGDFTSGTSTKEIVRICEQKISQAARDRLDASRACDAQFRTAWQSMSSKDSDDIERVANSVRACARVNALNAQSLEGKNASIRTAPISDFFNESARLQDELADSLFLVAAFNRAVAQNDVRIALSVVRLLVTEDAKSLVPPTLTTALLYSKYQELLTLTRHQQDQFNTDWQKAKSTLTDGTYVPF